MDFALAPEVEDLSRCLDGRVIPLGSDRPDHDARENIAACCEEMNRSLFGPIGFFRSGFGKG